MQRTLLFVFMRSMVLMGVMVYLDLLVVRGVRRCGRPRRPVVGSSAMHFFLRARSMSRFQYGARARRFQRNDPRSDRTRAGPASVRLSPVVEEPPAMEELAEACN